MKDEIPMNGSQIDEKCLQALIDEQQSDVRKAKEELDLAKDVVQITLNKAACSLLRNARECFLNDQPRPATPYLFAVVREQEKPPRKFNLDWAIHIFGKSGLPENFQSWSQSVVAVFVLESFSVFIEDVESEEG